MLILNYIRFLTKHRNMAEIILRGMCLWKRYGLNTDNMQKYLSTYQELLARYDVTPTFFIPGDVLERHTQLVQTLVNGKVDLGIHGYHHIDFTELPFRKQKQQIEQAIRAFERASVIFSGFRAPYLYWNSHMLDALEECNISWDSSRSILWNVIDEKNTKEWSRWLRVLTLYNYGNASDYISVPHLRNSLVEIPVSLPDDDMLIDRLANVPIHKIWAKILDETYEKGELFTLQLHPERIMLCKHALESILKASKSYEPPVWIAPLSEIAHWWREKDEFNFKITEERKNHYHIYAICSERALVLAKNTKYSNNFFNGYKIIKGGRFTIESSTRPAIGISKHASLNLIKFLKNEGFFFEISDNKEQYGIYFDGDMNIQENEKEPKILCLIEQLQFPIIRFWRWPNGYKSALSVTGDIDALTSLDFFLRFLKAD
jgi:peptidoglycan/xylan/chitin deacetylase (PgdA/CDA1 family)